MIASLILLRRYGACCGVLCLLLVASSARAEPWFFNHSGGGIKFNSSAEVCEDWRKTVQKSADEVNPGGTTTIVVYPKVDIPPTEQFADRCIVNWRRGNDSSNYEIPVYAGGCWPGRAPKPGVDLSSFFAEPWDCVDAVTPPVPPAPPCDCPLSPGVEPADPAVGNPIFVLRGIKRESVDAGLRLAGTALRFTYDSGQRAPQTGTTTLQPVPMSAKWASGDLLGSVLWSSSLHRRAVIGSMAPGSAFAVRMERGDGVVKVIGVDGSGNFSFDPADRGRLVRLASGELRYDDAQEGVQEVYTAAGQLTTMAWPDGRRLDFTYSDANTPIAIAPAAGLLLQVTDTNGRSLNFAYGAPAGFGIRLASVTDSAGQTVTLAYDSRNNLSSLQWTDGTTRSFHYENGHLPWALTGVTDEKARRHATFGYDAAGRAISSEHAGGVSRYSVTYATPPSLAVNEQFDGNTLRRQVGWTLPQGTVVTGPTGAASQWDATNLNGRNFLTARSQAAGAGSASGMRAQSYDTHGYVASQDDFNGTRMCFSNDPERNLQLARVEGLAAGADCAVLGAASLPAKARKTSTQWHPDWRRPIKVAAPGQLTTSIYNGQPDPFNGNAIASCAPTSATLPDGKPVVLPCKQVTQATLDADGAKGMAVAGQQAVAGDPNGADPAYAGVSLLLHMDGSSNATGLVDSSPNANGVNAFGAAAVSPTAARYGVGGLALSGASGGYVTAPAAALDVGAGDFTVEGWVRLNAFGNESTLISNYGDGGARGLEILTSKAGEIAVRWSTDGTNSAGTLLHPNRLSLNTWAHFAAVRQGGTMRLFLDGAPSASAVISGAVFSSGTPVNLGRTPDTGSGVWYMNGALDDIRITKGLARYTQAFARPNAGLPGKAAVAAMPSLLNTAIADRVQQWTYNEFGQVLTAKTTRNGVTVTTSSTYYADTNAYHTKRDVATTTDAAGKTTTYDKYAKAGQLLQSTDSDGVLTINTYDLRQRLLSTAVGGETTTYAYDPVGQMILVIQHDGSWIAYEYDDAHRQKAVSDDSGNRIDYALDNAGNSTGQTVKDPTGSLKRNMARVMDALGRAQENSGRE